MGTSYDFTGPNQTCSCFQEDDGPTEVGHEILIDETKFHPL